MARDKTVFKALVNRLCDHLGGAEIGSHLGPEGELAVSLDASRTTIRAALNHLVECGVLSWQGRDKILLRLPRDSDRFDVEETRTKQETVETPFLSWVLQSDLPPGTNLNEAELARRFDVPVAALREFLIRFEPFGLIEKRPNRHWILKGFTREFAEEMFAVREMFESRALQSLLNAAGDGGSYRMALLDLRDRHQSLLQGDDAGLAAFPALDAEFHQLLCASSNNRFIVDFSRTISIIVHYHYRWNKRDEARRNRAALAEHLSLIESVLAQDRPRAAQALALHLETARETLMASVHWTDPLP